MLSPFGFEVLSTTQRMPYQDANVTTTTDLRASYDVFSEDSRLAGYAYDPSSASDGLEYASQPETLSAPVSSTKRRFIDISVDQSADSSSVETVFGRTLPVEVVTTDAADDVVFTDVSGAPAIALRCAG